MNAVEGSCQEAHAGDESLCSLTVQKYKGGGRWHFTPLALQDCWGLLRKAFQGLEENTMGPLNTPGHRPQKSLSSTPLSQEWLGDEAPICGAWGRPGTETASSKKQGFPRPHPLRASDLQQVPQQWRTCLPALLWQHRRPGAETAGVSSLTGPGAGHRRSRRWQASVRGREETSPLPPLSSSGWSNHQTDLKQINRRK